MPTSTLSFVAHEDDDLLFMAPDILGDIRAGYRVTVVYLTAGNLLDGAAGAAYAELRMDGARAAYAVGAGKLDTWTAETLTFAERKISGYRLDSNPLVRLLSLNLDAAAGATDPGDLHRMWLDPTYVAQPIDGRPGYTRAQLVATLRAITAWAAPNWARRQDTTGQDNGDHVDHVAAAHLAAEALSPGGITQTQCWEYLGYTIEDMPPNLTAAEIALKRAAWQAYRPHDPQVGPTSWDNVMDRQYRRLHYPVGSTWTPRLTV